MSEKKIFEEYRVDCNDCSHYWNDTCDGVPQDLERTCTAYKATKRIDLVKRVERLEKDLGIYVYSTILLNVLVIALIIMFKIG